MWGATGTIKIHRSCKDISIHAPRVGSDIVTISLGLGLPTFQSTLPVWGATEQFLREAEYLKISIHAPRVGSDPFAPFKFLNANISIHAPRVGSDYANDLHQSELVDFNPRSPCGERQDGTIKIHRSCEFQSTLPVWGATGCTVKRDFSFVISIHAPRVGSDTRFHWKDGVSSMYFNPRSPCGERPNPGSFGVSA